MARKARKPAKGDVKDAVKRAMERSKGGKPKKRSTPRVMLDPVIVKAEDIATPVEDIAKALHDKAKAVVEEIAGKGRPTDYRPEMAEQARIACERGATDDDLAELLGVTRRTVLRWKLQHEDFCRAVSIGKEVADDRVERSLYERAVGFEVETEKIFCFQGEITRARTREYNPADVGAIKLWLTNRRPGKWADTSRKELTGPGGGPVLTADVSKLELARWIAHQLMQAQAEPQALDVEAESVSAR